MSSVDGHVSSVTAFETFRHLLCPGINSREMSGHVHMNKCTRMFLAAIHNIPRLEATQMFVNREWSNKQWHIHTMKYYSEFKKEKSNWHREVCKQSAKREAKHRRVLLCQQSGWVREGHVGPKGNGNIGLLDKTTWMYRCITWKVLYFTCRLEMFFVCSKYPMIILKNTKSNRLVSNTFELKSIVKVIF